ncbi:hypothetical protein I5168_11905 [Nonlabens sp. SCSIO 43208]|uniref:hypothetical protein n=1 Tax=Nonlabens sp. SCSIO 43208 TaxID=2793009 RepID=UPI003D6C3ACE
MYMILPHYDSKKNGKLKPQDILKFTWDEQPEQEKSTKPSIWDRIGPMAKQVDNG